MKKLPSYLSRVISQWWTSILWPVTTAPFNTSLLPKARHTGKINSANQELRAVRLGDTCWQSSCFGYPGKTCLRCRKVYMICRCPVRHTEWVHGCFTCRKKSEQLRFHKPHPHVICTMPQGCRLSSFSRVSPRHSFYICSGGSSHIPKI